MKRSNAGKTTPCPNLSSSGNEGRFQMVGLEELIMAAAIRACAESAEPSGTPSQTRRGKVYQSLEKFFTNYFYFTCLTGNPKGEQKTLNKANDSGNESREENPTPWENFETLQVFQTIVYVPNIIVI